MDVLSASYNDNKIAWYKNDGSESFTAATISTSAEGAESVYAVDLDGDGDMDVLSASYNDWFYGELCVTGKNRGDYKACYGRKEREYQGNRIICYGGDGENL